MRIIYTKNHDFFKNLKNPEVLYVLGLFAADGHIGHNKLVISLSLRDRELLERVRDLLNSNSKLRIVGEKNKNGISTGPMVLLSICSKEIVSDLIGLGYTSNKTYNGFSLPNVSDDLMWHFIRGYFDGDGHFSYRNVPKIVGNKSYNNKCYKFEICSKTDTCLRQIKNFFEKYNISATIRYDETKKVFNLSCGGVNNVYKIFEHLYKDSNIHLNRKYSAFLEAEFNKKIQGVYRYKDRYKCAITKNKNHIFLGIYDTQEQASKIRDIASLLLNGKLAKLNDETSRIFTLEEENLVKKYFMNFEKKY
jgi:hypothetical protein